MFSVAVGTHCFVEDTPGRMWKHDSHPLALVIGKEATDDGHLTVEIGGQLSVAASCPVTYSIAWEMIFGKISLRTLLCFFFASSKVNKTQVTAFSHVYTFASDLIDTAVSFHSELRMCERGICLVI